MSFSQVLFLFRWPSGDLFETKVTPRDPLKRREIICEFKKCFRKDDGENKEHYFKATDMRSKSDT
jgi:hypothetical protein